MEKVHFHASRRLSSLYVKVSVSKLRSQEEKGFKMRIPAI